MFPMVVIPVIDDAIGIHVRLAHFVIFVRIDRVAPKRVCRSSSHLDFTFRAFRCERNRTTRKRLTISFRYDFADHVPAGTHILERIQAPLIKIGRLIVPPGYRVRFMVIQRAVVVQVGINNDPRYARFNGVALAIAIEIFPLAPVNGCKSQPLVAEIDFLDRRSRIDEYDMRVGIAPWWRLVPGWQRGKCLLIPALARSREPCGSQAAGSRESTDQPRQNLCRGRPAWSRRRVRRYRTGH